MFRPYIYVRHVKDINLEKLKENNIKLLAFDLDNTLDIPDKLTTSIIPEVDSFLKEVENQGFSVLIISNNKIEGRVESFAKIKGYDYIEWARKPFQKNYKNNDVLKKYSRDEVCFIGDKLVTDVLGGNRYGSKTILVDPLCPKNTHWYTRIMKFSESVFTRLIGFKKGEYYE